METEDFEEAADLALTTLVEVDLKMSGVIGMTDDLLEAEMLPFFDGALEEARREGRVVVAVKDDLVALDDTSRGMHDLVGEFAVVGQDQ